MVDNEPKGQEFEPSGDGRVNDYIESSKGQENISQMVINY